MIISSFVWQFKKCLLFLKLVHVMRQTPTFPIMHLSMMMSAVTSMITTQSPPIGMALQVVELMCFMIHIRVLNVVIGFR